MSQEGFDTAGPRIKDHDTEAIIGNEDSTILVYREAIGPSVILGGHIELTVGRHPQYAAVGDIDHVEVAVPVEGRSPEEAIQTATRMICIDPGREG